MPNLARSPDRLAEIDSEADLQQLIARAQANDPGAIERIYQMFEMIAYNFIYRRVERNTSVAWDILQDTFMRMMTGLKNYRDEGKFVSWLLVIASNCIVEHFRRNRRYVDECPNQEEVVGETAEHADDKIMIDQALNALKIEDQRIIQDIHNGYSFDEVATRTGMKTGATKMRYYRALEKLKVAIGEGS